LDFRLEKCIVNTVNLVGPAMPPSDVQIENRKSKIENPDHEKLHKATREMESYFVGTLLKKMHETAAKGGLFEEKSESATYREMFDDAVAKEIGKRGSFGIADTLYKELVVGVDAQAAERAQAASATPAQENGEKNGG